MKYALPFICALFLMACAESGPVPIAFGSDQCADCKMTITEQTYAAELITSTGKAYKFDAPECLFAFYLQDKAEPKDKVGSLWVTNFINPGELIDAHKAFYHHSEHLHSPMGMNVSAYTSKSAREQAAMHFPGEELSYDAVLKLAADY